MCLPANVHTVLEIMVHRIIRASQRRDDVFHKLPFIVQTRIRRERETDESSEAEHID